MFFLIAVVALWPSEFCAQLFFSDPEMRSVPSMALPEDSEDLIITVNFSTLNTGGYTDTSTPEVLMYKLWTDELGRLERILFFDRTKKAKISSKVNYIYPSEDKVFIIETDSDSIPLYSWTLVDSTLTEVEKYKNGKYELKWIFESGDSHFESVKKYDYQEGKKLIREEVISRDSSRNVVQTCLIREGELEGMNYYGYDDEFNSIEEIHAFSKRKVKKAAKRLGRGINELCGLELEAIMTALNDRASKYTYEYDDEGNRIKWFEFKPNGNLDYEARAKYDENGKVTELVRIFSSTHRTRIVYAYDDSENEKSRRMYRGQPKKEKLFIETQYERDELGRVKQIAITNYAGYTRDISTYSWTYRKR